MTESHEDLYVELRRGLLHPIEQEMQLRIAVMQQRVLEIERALDELSGWKWSRHRGQKIGRLRTEKLSLEGRLRDELDAYAKCTATITGLRERYRAMCSVPRVLAIELIGRLHSNPALAITTDVLYGMSKNDKTWHRVGRFRIVAALDATKLDICFKNLDGMVDVGKKRGAQSYLMHGPTDIQSNGAVTCFGNAKPIITTALKEADDLGLVEILTRYPECAGAHDYIRFWPQVEVSEVPQWYLANT